MRNHHLVGSKLGIAAVVFTLCSACADRGPSGSVVPESGDLAAFEAVSSLHYGRLDSAFTQLAGRSFTVTVTTTERDAEGTFVARRVDVNRFGPAGNLEARETDSATGTFSDGLFSFIAGSDSSGQGRVRQLGRLVPATPAFAELKTREQFLYESVGDTMVSGESTRLFELRSHDTAQHQPLRLARVAATKTDDAILFFQLSRRDRSVFYDEQSNVLVELVRSGPEEFLPVRMRYDTRVDVPTQPPRRFTIEENYDYADPATLPE